MFCIDSVHFLPYRLNLFYWSVSVHLARMKVTRYTVVLTFRLGAFRFNRASRRSSLLHWKGIPHHLSVILRLSKLYKLIRPRRCDVILWVKRPVVNVWINLLGFWETAQPGSHCNIKNVKLYILSRISIIALPHAEQTPRIGTLGPTLKSHLRFSCFKHRKTTFTCSCLLNKGRVTFYDHSR